MNITLYENLSDNRTLNKNIINKGSLSATLKDNCDVLNPVLIVNTFDFINVNYIYIPNFKRYYYILNTRVLTGQRVEVQCSVDVLMSYKYSIKKLTVNVLRQEGIKPTEYKDNRFPVLPRSTQKIVEFPNNIFNIQSGSAVNKNFLLIITGGVNNEN